MNNPEIVCLAFPCCDTYCDKNNEDPSTHDLGELARVFEGGKVEILQDAARAQFLTLKGKFEK